MEDEGVDESRGIKRKMSPNTSLQLQSISRSGSQRTFRGTLPSMRSSSGEDSGESGEEDEERQSSTKLNSSSSSRSPTRLSRAAPSSGSGSSTSSELKGKGKGKYTPPAGDLEL